MNLKKCTNETFLIIKTMNEDLYYRIDADEEMTDAEKRETYFIELENKEFDQDEY